FGSGPRVTVVDLGSKRSIPQRLAHAGLEAYVVPGAWGAGAILETKPRAVLIANGPGDPAVLTEQVETIRDLLGVVPLFGVCLGHQLLGLALGHDVQAPLRASRREPSGAGRRERPRPRHRAEPRLRRARERRRLARLAQR